MSCFASYGWIIDTDHLVTSGVTDASESRVGTFGPSGIHPRIEATLTGKGDLDPPPPESADAWASLLVQVRRWRCMDDDGELYYEGRFIGPESRIFAPLEDFAMPDAGATTIEYLAPSGAWEAL